MNEHVCSTLLLERSCQLERKALEGANCYAMRAFDTSDLTNIDTVDAALCALTARYFLSGNVKTYGDDVEGFFVIPAIIEGKL